MFVSNGVGHRLFIVDVKLTPTNINREKMSPGHESKIQKKKLSGHIEDKLSSLMDNIS